MKNTGRIVLSTCFILTVMIVFYDYLFQGTAPSQLLKFGARVVMFFVAFFAKKRYGIQKVLAVAFFMTVVADFFFQAAPALALPIPDYDIYGIVSFVVAYLLLIMAFRKKAKMRKKDIFLLLPYALVFLVIIVQLKPYMDQWFFYASVLLGVILSYASMTMMATVYRGYFWREIGWAIGLSGLVLFVSDVFVAYSMFHPMYKGFVFWQEVVIWSTYMFGWGILLVLTVDEDNLKVNVH